jgi:membrane protein YqaA with SNARE-associated domain
MADEPHPAPKELPHSFWLSKPFRIFVILAVLGLSVAIFALRKQFAEMAAIGYPGIFLVSLLGNATIVLPAPSLALVFAMGSALPPLFVGLAAGAGEALGELTGYVAGFGGRAVTGDQKTFQRLEAWMERAGGITIFVLSMVPNPFFDLAGIAAGALHYPVGRFLLACWLGKSLKTILVAWAGAQSFTLIKPLLG